jgi:hypothetical protein
MTTDHGMKPPKPAPEVRDYPTLSPDHPLFKRGYVFGVTRRAASS